MKCEDVKQWLEGSRTFAKGSEEGLSNEISEHLVACPECTLQRQREDQFDHSIHRVIQDLVIPAQLEKSILWRLRQARRQRQRAWVVYGSLAAAAAFLMALCLNWYFQRPYDLAYLQEALNGIELRRNIVRHDIVAGASAAELKQWLSRQGIAASIPARLKLSCVKTAYVVETSGRKVAVLELQSGTSTSKVCLLQRRYFNEPWQRQMREQSALSSFVIADHDQSESLGWMIVDQGSAHLFVEGTLPHNGA